MILDVFQDIIFIYLFKNWRTKKMNYQFIINPLIGAGIGYVTNWIAIKMMFRPTKAIKIGKFTLPFTPGIIPTYLQKTI